MSIAGVSFRKCLPPARPATLCPVVSVPRSRLSKAAGIDCREPITPAARSLHAGCGVFAIATAALCSLEGSGERHQWRPNGGKVLMDMSSFLAWLPASSRRWLGTWSANWERPASDAVRMAIAAVEHSA
jgi:hypothetical protein